MKAVFGLTGGLILIAGTFLFAKEYFLDVTFGMVFFGIVFDNARLRKKLKDLGRPDDIKSRYEAQQRAKGQPPAN